MRGQSTWVTAAVIVGVIVAPVIAGVAPVAAQTSTSSAVEVDAPSTVTTGQATTVNVSVTAPSVKDLNVSGTVNLTLAVDGKVVAERNFTLADGRSRTVSFEYTFQTNGTYTVTANASATVFNRTLSQDDSVTITATDRPVLPGQAAPVADIDGDGLFEDLNGDGGFDIRDIAVFLATFDSDIVRQNAADFDYTGDGEVTIVDVARLLARL